MTASGPLRVAIALALCGAVACKYDLEKLRNSDAAPLVDMTAPPVDAPDVTVIDMPSPTDVPRDTTQPRDTVTRPPRMGTCNSHAFVDLVGNASNTFGSTIVVNGNTMADTPVVSTFTRPVFGMACSDTPSMMAAPERVFKYVVRSGPRLVATTNGAPCSGMFDTVLYALNSCDSPLSGTNVLDCDDDDVQICDMCPAGVTCNNHLSTVEIGPVQAGDVVYLVVDGYETQSGPFRLSVTENGARPTAPPAAARMNHCTCPTLAGSTARLIDGFPNASIDGNMRFRAAGDTVAGLRPALLRTVTGVAGQFRMGANNIAPQGSCANAKAIIDVLIENNVVASFQLTGVQEPGSVVQVMYSTFAAVTVTDRTMIPVAYRLRAFDPESCVGSFDIATPTMGGVNTLTLFGTPP